jgi:hypothetical protein
MSDKLGKLVQKSNNPFCRRLDNPRFECSSNLAKQSTFALLERDRKSAQMSVTLKRAAD